MKTIRNIDDIIANSSLSDHHIKLIKDFFSKDIQEYLTLLQHLNNTISSKHILFNDNEYKTFKYSSDEILRKGAILANNLQSNIIINKIKDKFRDIVGQFVYQSTIMKRAYEKPRGYPGDYQTLEYLYNHQVISSELGVLFDQYFLQNELAQAVINRKNLMSLILSDYINTAKNDQINIFNIASGSCRDIKEIIINNNNINKHITFNCLDQDSEAIAFSKDALISLNKININFIEDEVIRFARKIPESFSKKQNIIYSIGLADYMPDRLLKMIISSFFEILNPKGKMFIAHKDKHKFSTLPPDWFCDWKFIPRDEPEFTKLINDSGISNFSLTTIREDTNIIFFAIIDKK